MAALSGDDLLRAVDLAIENVLREHRHSDDCTRTAAMRVAMRELLNPRPMTRNSPPTWDTADISYEEPR